MQCGGRLNYIKYKAPSTESQLGRGMIINTMTKIEKMSDNKVEKVNTLGSVRLRDAHTNEIILVPSPSNDPNDPLNWYVQLAPLLQRESIDTVEGHGRFDYTLRS